MARPSFVIRIRLEDSEDMDWMVESDQLDFSHSLEVISKVVAHSSVSAYDYEDEDGDRITVRSDEEMKAMVENYFVFLSGYNMTPDCLPPLVIYPRTGKSSEKRNIHKLKVKTKSLQAKKSNHHSPMDQTSSNKQEPLDLRAILSSGQVEDSNLRYIEILGSGNGGTVYRAQHRLSRIMMAVKVIPLDLTPEIQSQITSELEILYKCKSPVIIGFYGAFFLENRISICTEFMDGGSLDYYGQVPEVVLGRITVSVVTGLQYLWTLKIMHRDVKPSNILVNTQGQVKLCDFGVSVQLVNSLAATYVGTNAYMAPERLDGKAYKNTAEVWSLGVTLFELCTGKFPYETAKAMEKPIQLLNSIIKEDPPRLQVGIFSPMVVDFVSNCMEKSPNARPSPEGLLKHPFIKQYSDSNYEIVAVWVRSKLEHITLTKLKQKSSA